MDDLIEQFREDYEMVTFDHLDEAIIGVASQWSKQPLVVYDREKMLRVFMKQNHWSYEEAEEWVGYNVDQVWAGEGTPLIMVRPEDEDVPRARSRMGALLVVAGLVVVLVSLVVARKKS